MIALKFLGALADFETLVDIGSVQGVEAFINLLTWVYMRTIGNLDAGRGSLGNWGPKFLGLAGSTGKFPGIGGHGSILGCDPTEYLPELENQEISRLLQLSWTLHLYVSPTVH